MDAAMDLLHVWRIAGESCNDSGGGVRVVYALNDNSLPPDADASLRVLAPNETRYRIDSITLIGHIPLVLCGRSGDDIEALQRLVNPNQSHNALATV